MAYKSKDKLREQAANEPAIMRPMDVAIYYGVAVNTVWRWVKSGVLPQPTRLGRRFAYWQREEIENALAALRNRAS